MRRLGHQLSRKKLVVLGLLTVLLVAIAIAYIFGSFNAWNTHKNELLQHTANIHALDKSILYDKTISNDARADKTKQLVAADQSKLCRVSGLYSWQANIFTNLSAQHESCLQAKESISKIQSAAKNLADYRVDEQAALKQLKGLILPKEPLTSKSFDTISATVVKVLAALKQQAPKTEEGLKLQKLTVQKTTVLAASWEKVQAADEAQDQSAYANAINNLQKAYAEQTTVVDQSKDSYKRLMTALQSADQAL